MIAKIAATLVAVMLIIGGLPSPAAELVWIWRYDGSRQCAMGVAQSLEDGKKSVEAAGATVLATRKVLLPRATLYCGAPTGIANTYQLSVSDWAKIKAGFKGAYAEWHSP